MFATLAMTVLAHVSNHSDFISKQYRVVVMGEQRISQLNKTIIVLSVLFSPCYELEVNIPISNSSIHHGNSVFVPPRDKIEQGIGRLN